MSRRYLAGFVVAVAVVGSAVTAHAVCTRDVNHSTINDSIKWNDGDKKAADRAGSNIPVYNCDPGVYRFSISFSPGWQRGREQTVNFYSENGFAGWWPAAHLNSYVDAASYVDYSTENYGTTVGIIAWHKENSGNQNRANLSWIQSNAPAAGACPGGAGSLVASYADGGGGSVTICANKIAETKSSPRGTGSSGRQPTK